MTRACIIGAGSSGIIAAQILTSKGIDVDCFELGSQVGGLWRYDNDNGQGSAYRSLHINTSREMMQYAAYPMPESLPDYPSHWQIAEYFDAFVDHFGLRDKITFNTEVIRVEPAEGSGAGRYAVTIRTRGATSEPEVRYYDHVGRGVRHRELRHRHRGRVLPCGRAHLPRDAPWRVHPAQVPLRRTDRSPHQLAVGARAVPGAEAGNEGDAAPGGGEDDRLRLAPTGSRRPRGPPDDQAILSADDNHVDLYRRVVTPDRPGLYFIGLIQPIGAIMPLAEEQCHWVAELIEGTVRLPSPAELRAQIAAYDAALRKRYVRSKRHTIQVDAHAYLAELRKERTSHRV
ncbi:MAG: NAD(P)-binding protein [Kineosporiaceae bacterium]